MEPWDGIWTYELLRDLCGGVTRDAGEFNVTGKSLNRKYFHNPFDKPIVVKRTGYKSYRIQGDDLDGEEAVKRLARLQAVPLYDNGKEWAVRLRELPEGVCSDCEGAGEFECDECEGKGSRECDLGHDHDCDDCNATGSVKCHCQFETIKPATKASKAS